jgi:hypothetical protein
VQVKTDLELSPFVLQTVVLGGKLRVHGFLTRQPKLCHVSSQVKVDFVQGPLKIRAGTSVVTDVGLVCHPRVAE